MKMEALTPQQEEKMIEIRDYWLDFIFSCKNSIDKEKAEQAINWLYEFCGNKKPTIIYVSSPMACQYVANILKDNNCTDDIIKHNIINNLTIKISNDVNKNVWDNIQINNIDNNNIELINVIKDNIKKNKKNKKELNYEYVSDYGNIGDYGWVAFYDFFTEIGILKNENFNNFKKLLLSGIYDMIQLEDICIVSDMPVRISRNARNLLHCEDKSAIEFKDGYKEWYWNGVSVPQKLIETPELVTKEEILNEENAEVRRCYMEKLGAERYYDILGGVVLIDEDTDEQGNLMKLFRSKDKDSVIDDYIYFLNVICPSTKRTYNLYPLVEDYEDAKRNVWAAKASTFRNEKLFARHGDVGLVKQGVELDKPFIET